jgi:hypothetical protein
MKYLETFCFQADINCLKQLCCESGFDRVSIILPDTAADRHPGPDDPGPNWDLIYFTN